MMANFEYFRVVLDRQNEALSGGETLSGKLVFSAFEQLKIEKIFVQVIGKAGILWTEKQSKSEFDKLRLNYCSSEETYLDEKIILSVKEPDVDLFLVPGEVTYQFEITLPLDLPSSFQHQFGKIRYFVRATIEIPWESDYCSETSFSVVKHLMLGSNPFWGLAQAVTGTKKSGFCCYKKDAIIATLKTVKVGFVPGESIMFTVIIDNRSKSLINFLAVKLFQDLTFYARSVKGGKNKTKKCQREVVATICPQQIKPDGHYRWNGALSIPPACTTINTETSEHCKLVCVEYFIRLDYHSENLAPEMSMKIPVVLGSVPIEQADHKCKFEQDVFKLINLLIEEDDATTDQDIFTPVYPCYEFGMKQSEETVVEVDNVIFI